MSKIVVGGASGQVGSLIAENLIAQVPPESLTLLSRTPENLSRFAERGANVRFADYRDVESLAQAFRGAHTIMVISGLDIGRRVPQHRSVIAEAKAAGVRHIVYTSVSGIHPTNNTPSSLEHSATEGYLRECGIPVTMLRSACYSEIFLLNAAMAYRTGAWLHAECPGPHRLAPIARADVARSAAACLLNAEKHGGAVYELTGPELLTMERMTQIIGEEFGKPINYRAVDIAERYRGFDEAGVPRAFGPNDMPHPETHFYGSDEIAIFELFVSQGLHGLMSDHVEYITGRKPQDFRSVMAENAANGALDLS